VFWKLAWECSLATGAGFSTRQKHRKRFSSLAAQRRPVEDPTFPLSASDSHDDVTVVVLAGGRGTRIQALHPETPKPLFPVRGRPFLYWLTSLLAGHGLSHFVYSTGYRAEQIEAWCTNDDFPEIARVCRREPQPLGTGGGLLNCLDACREWVLVANGDSLCIGGIRELLELRREVGLAGALVGVWVEDVSRYGSLSIDDQGRLVAFREKVPGAGLINGGFYLFRADLLRTLRPGTLSIECDLIPGMIATGTELRIIRLHETAFIDIGTPESLALAERFIGTHLACYL
jgi:NDP-sugar pyrophosphorylase family protein